MDSTHNQRASASLTLHYDDGTNLRLETDRLRAPVGHSLFPKDARTLWTDAERRQFWEKPFSLHSASLLIRGLQLYANKDTTPEHERGKVMTRNIALTIGYALGFGQSTVKWVAGDDIPFEEIKKETPGNLFALLPAIGLVNKARTMLRAESAALTGFQMIRAARPFESEMGAVADEAIAALDAGRMESGELLQLHPYGASSEVKGVMGVRGQFTHQAAHAGPQTALKNLANYNASQVLTRTMPTAAHTSMDAFWKTALAARRARGQTTITAGDLYRMVSESIRRSNLSRLEQESHIAHLSDELFMQLGLSEGSVLRL
jgi:hypothetical protein